MTIKYVTQLTDYISEEKKAKSMLMSLMSLRGQWKPEEDHSVLMSSNFEKVRMNKKPCIY